MAYLFETEDCSRCSGTGNYSYCQTHGTICFRCHGNKKTLTKKGFAAQAMYTELLSKSIFDIKVGDIVLHDKSHFNCIKMVWMRVESIYPSKCTQIIDGKTVYYNAYDLKELNGKYEIQSNYPEDSTTRFRVKQDTTLALKRSLEYQDQLTKKGTLKKKHLKKAGN